MGLIVRNDNETLEISCSDIASVAWGIYKNVVSFRKRFGIDAVYSDDFNGGGEQSIELAKGKCIGHEDFFLRAIFSHFGESNSIYEADLRMDGSRDYHPTRNLGRTKFFARLVVIDMANPPDVLEWVNESYLHWRSELARLSEPHSNLAEWAESRLDMAVKCRNFSCVRDHKIIPNSELKVFASSGISLEDLQSKLVCRECGQRGPWVSPY